MTAPRPAELRTIHPAQRPLPAALALGETLVAAARRDGLGWITASVVQGPAVVLGAAQRAGRVLDLEACAGAGAAVFRRATTGTAGAVAGEAILWTLALPHVATLAPDATPATLLNRNVRGFLQGLTRAGALAHYFGREWLALAHRPGALVGFDVARDGVVLIEVLAGFDHAIAPPSAWLTAGERAIDRWRGRAPVALAELVSAQRDALAVANTVIAGVAARARVALAATTLDAAGPVAPSARAITDPRDPVPAGYLVSESTSVPIGLVEAAVDHNARAAWLGGDVLAPRWALDEVCRAVIARDAPALDALAAVPLEGARLDDLVAAVQRADAAS